MGGSFPWPEQLNGGNQGSDGGPPAMSQQHSWSQHWKIFEVILKNELRQFKFLDTALTPPTWDCINLCGGEFAICLTVYPHIFWS